MAFSYDIVVLSQIWLLLRQKYHFSALPDHKKHLSLQKNNKCLIQIVLF